MLLASRLLGPWDRIIEPVTKLADAPGKGPLAFTTSLLLILAVLTYKFFGKDATPIPIGASLCYRRFSGVTSRVTWIVNFWRNVARPDLRKFSHAIEMTHLDEWRQFRA